MSSLRLGLLHSFPLHYRSGRRQMGGSSLRVYEAILKRRLAKQDFNTDADPECSGQYDGMRTLRHPEFISGSVSNHGVSRFKSVE